MHFHWEEVKDDRFKYEEETTESLLPIPQWEKVTITTELKNKILPTFQYNSCILSTRYMDYMERIMEMDISPDDVWITTYPKSGTTWAQEMVWLIKNNFDFDTAKSISLVRRSPTLRQL